MMKVHIFIMETVIGNFLHIIFLTDVCNILIQSCDFNYIDYLFLGDYGDQHSLETIIVLL